MTNRLNTIQPYYKQSLLVKDCITVFLLNNQFQYGMNDYMSDQINNETEIESRQVICILIMQKGLDVKVMIKLLFNGIQIFLMQRFYFDKYIFKIKISYFFSILVSGL